VRGAESTLGDEITLVGGGLFPVFFCCQRRSYTSSSWIALKERAAALLFKARSPHRSSCHRRATERRPSTEIRLELYSAQLAYDPLPTFFEQRLRFAKERDPPRVFQARNYKPVPAILMRGACYR
jgi:hypothetical protein